MLLEEFDYTLPAELIAQRPLAERDASRMMVLDRAAKQWEDRAFGEISQLLQPDDLLVFNNTKVFPARLLGRRRGITAQPVGKNNPAQRGFLTGETELLLTRQESEDIWQGLVHPGRKVRTGEVLVFGDDELEAEILGRGEYGVRRARLRARTGTIEEALDRLGHVPLPPYIHRRDEASDRATYQTVYAKVRGAVAAPTAGLHFTQRVLSALAARGVETCEITLHVGLGTFQPVRAKQIEDHHMEAERYEISEAAAAAINRALDAAPARHRRGDNERPHARKCGARARRKHRARPRRNAPVHHSGIPIPGHSRTAYQLSSSSIDAAHAGLRICGKRLCAARLPPCSGSALPVLQLRRLHVDSVAVLGFSANPV